MESMQDQEIGNNKALRYNKGKRQWSLVDFKALEPMVEVLEFGANKYARDNWKKGMPYTEMCDSLLRHTYAFMRGEDNDPESGISHLGHMMCNVLFLSNYMKNRPEYDDRPEEQEYKLKEE